MIRTLRTTALFALILLAAVAFIGCSEDDDNPITPGDSWMATNPDDAPKASIDRFSADAGMLMVRDGSNGLPEANVAIDFDSGEPFITMGLGPDGEMVQYYNFDVQPTAPAPIYVLIRDGEDAPVEGQLNIVDVIPGDDGYNDFWQPHFVTVPEDYLANSITSYDQIMDGGYAIEAMPALVNCPIVPDGSTASMRLAGESAGLTRGWYNDQVVYYFNFSEKALAPVGGLVPLSPIYVSFNINPDQPDGGPASGFMTESGSSQTHNVIATLPEDAAYSPLWSVNPYDNNDFMSVFNLEDATMANVLDMGVATVNCPVVSIGGDIAMPMNPDDAPKASIDRFSADAGMLMVRDGSNGLPAANEAIDFDSGEPFITMGLGPNGEMVQYYNFDVQPTEPAPIYVLIRDGEDAPVEGQLNIVDVIPGDDGYNDFWQPHFVTVPEDYLANSITSYDQIMDGGYAIEAMPALVNCPIVPDGSTASMRLAGESAGLTRGWYKDQVVYYFNFSEDDLMTSGGMVPLSPIYVSFNINPDQPDGGPGSGFKTEDGSSQTHNVIATLPGDGGYSPLWSVNPYDNADFMSVFNLEDATMANILDMGVANVNCPVVSVGDMIAMPMDPDSAPKASVDRFSADAGMLMVRDDSNGLPEANEAIDFDSGEPFITQGLGPNGEMVEYYNFDVQPTDPAPIYVLIRDGEDSPVDGQLNIVDVKPGDDGYNDFWQVHFVNVPSTYGANIVHSYDQIMDAGYDIEATDMIVNCPVVPEGSSATKRFADGDTGLTRGWYKDQVVYYFNFVEQALTASGGMVPVSPIYVTFNINPDQPDGGPGSGFVTEDGNDQTHNVVATLPGDAGYSPLWSVNPYDNADFADVMDLNSAQMANVLDMGVALVNCPIVTVP